MDRFHVNPETGTPTKCSAEIKCKFSETSGHYDSKDEARAAYEASMGLEETLPKTAERPQYRGPAPSPFRFTPRTYSSVGYDYDTYDCKYDDCGSQGEPCVDKVFGGLRVKPVTEEDVYNQVKGLIGSARDGGIPDGLKKIVDEDMNEWRDNQNWNVDIVDDCYGEVAEVIAPTRLTDKVEDWIYAQNNAVDPQRVLPYLRGMGMDTRGKKPLVALKDFLREQSNGNLPASVDEATSFTVESVKLEKIKLSEEDKARMESTSSKPLQPLKGTGSTSPVAGILLETKRGDVTSRTKRSEDKEYLIGETQLLDGFGRTKRLQESGSGRIRGTYIVLRK